MRYWGKLLGTVLGYLSGAGFWGVVVGFLFGHMVDRARIPTRGGYFASQHSRQMLFFITTFEVLGHLSKAKGRVTEADIQMASHFMQRLNLHGAARTSAQQAFRVGKEADYPLRHKLRELRTICFGRHDLIQMFLEIQLQMAFVDGQLHQRERQVLYVIAEELGISRQQFERYLSMMEGGRHFNRNGQQHGGYAGHQQGPTVEDACKVLGVQPGADVATIKRAYRKLMSEHHPDKLVAKGLPPEMMEMAKQKAQSIQAAYELLKKHKGFK
ncbi:MAG: co-chaperone DjlA [Enterobacteriaceae bacterium]